MGRRLAVIFATDFRVFFIVLFCVVAIIKTMLSLFWAVYSKTTCFRFILLFSIVSICMLMVEDGGVK